MASKKTYEKEQVLQILAEAKKEGDEAVRKRYSLANATLPIWRKKYRKGKQSHVLGNKITKVDPEIVKLRIENRRLRDLLGERLVDEVIKD